MPQPRKHASSADRQKAYRKRCACSRQVELTGKGLAAITGGLPLCAWMAAVERVTKRSARTR